MTPTALLQKLWVSHLQLSASAGALRSSLRAHAESVVEDHIALRTFNLPKVGLGAMAEPWLARGWLESGKYTFPGKHLRARSYSHPAGELPRIFISELCLEQVSPTLQRVAGECVEFVQGAGTDLLTAGRPWPAVDIATYQTVRAESEYAAWLIVFGYVANHFTVSVNHLKGFDNLVQLNQWVLEQGLSLNTSGGAIKGSRQQGLQQSSTLADLVGVEFSDGAALVPSCYTEFALRFDGFDGFLAGSADRIFESTDYRK